MATHTQDVTVVGWVGSDLRTYHLDGAGGTPYAQFRLASTRRVVDRRTGEFRDGPTLWFTVKAWRTLAVNLDRSLAKGDPVVVVGRLGQSEWVAQDGTPRSELVLEALAIGHDLAYGSSKFRRTLAGPRRGTDDAGTDAPGTPDGRAVADLDVMAAALVDDPWAVVTEPPGGEEAEPDEVGTAAAPGDDDLVLARTADVPAPAGRG